MWQVSLRIIIQYHVRRLDFIFKLDDDYTKNFRHSEIFSYNTSEMIHYHVTVQCAYDVLFSISPFCNWIFLATVNVMNTCNI